MVIAYLYKDLLNLYGNDGNIKILTNKLKQIGEEFEIVYPTVNDEMDFSKYDLVYMGSGTENNQLIAIEDLKRYKDDIRTSINNGKLFLITGNSLDIFGQSIVGEGTVPALEIFEYNSKAVDRIKKDVVYKADFLTDLILGFENHSCILENNNNPLWNDQSVKYNNFYGMYTEGPILVRNPEFLKHIISILVNDDSKLEKLDLKYEIMAYNNFKLLLGDLVEIELRRNENE